MQRQPTNKFNCVQTCIPHTKELKNRLTKYEFESCVSSLTFDMWQSSYFLISSFCTRPSNLRILLLISKRCGTSNPREAKSWDRLFSLTRKMVQRRNCRQKSLARSHRKKEGGNDYTEKGRLVEDGSACNEKKGPRPFPMPGFELTPPQRLQDVLFRAGRSMP